MSKGPVKNFDLALHAIWQEKGKKGEKHAIEA